MEFLIFSRIEFAHLGDHACHAGQVTMKAVCKRGWRI